MLMSDGIRHIGDGLLEVSEERLKGFLTPQDIDEVYEIEQAPFARLVLLIIIYLFATNFSTVVIV